MEKLTASHSHGKGNEVVTYPSSSEMRGAAACGQASEPRTMETSQIQMKEKTQTDRRLVRLLGEKGVIALTLLTCSSGCREGKRRLDDMQSVKRSPFSTLVYAVARESVWHK
jgi:hypothetical protein